MITVLTRIRSVPERYRARMREIVRAYTLVNERDEDWVDDFYAHRLAVAASPQPAPRAAPTPPPARAVRPAPRREVHRRDTIVTAHRRRRSRTSAP